MTTYYNENDPRAAAWLRELIHTGHIADGVVDERSIEDVVPQDLKEFTQCHFFAGIGGWSYALRLAGWPDDRPVWTGSCPCQPFSAAGKGLGEKDPRHLWPELLRLIQTGKPSAVFGEQVASAAGREWLAGVRADLEALAYDVGAADLCAAGVGSPHIRQRLYWVADANAGRERLEPRCGGFMGAGRAQFDAPSGFGRRGEVGGLGQADEHGSQGWGERLVECSYQWPPGQTNLAVLCTDGKARRFEPGAFPLANGIPARMGRLRGYGNAIVPQVAQAFIEAYLDVCNQQNSAPANSVK